MFNNTDDITDKEIIPIWDYEEEDKYHFTFIGYFEVNIHIYGKNDYHLWIYKHGKRDKEIVDEDYSSLDLLHKKLNEVVGAKTTLPFEKMLKLQEENK